MSVKSIKTEPKADAAVDVVVQIADIVLAHRGSGEKATLTTISRTAQRAAGLLAFKDRDTRIAAENAAAVEIARRSNLI
jgi:hypothetical protein